MSEERRMILNMVAEGKISPDEAEMLLQAIDESERAARSAAAESVRESAGGRLGLSIERVVTDSLKGLEDSLRHLELDLDTRLKDRDLHHKIHEKIRRAAERAAERAARAEERAARTSERAAERAAEHAERVVKRMRHAEHPDGPRASRTFIKVGVSIDKHTVETSETLSVPAQSVDRLVVDNRVGDVAVDFCQGGQLEVVARKTVWGEDQEDARARAEATQVELVRRGTDLVLQVIRPTITAVGVLMVKDTRLDYQIRVPEGVHLDVATKVGDVKVSGQGITGSWNLAAKVGDIQVQVAPTAGFRYHLETKLGSAVIDLPEISNRGTLLEGRVGDGSGQLTVIVKTGEISVRSQ